MADKQSRDPAVVAIEELADNVEAAFTTFETANKQLDESVASIRDRLARLEQAAARDAAQSAWKAGREPIWLRGESGERMRLLRPSENLAEVWGTAQATPGEIVRGLATGRWTDAAEKAALGGGSATSGGVLLSPAVSATIIDLARARSAVVRAGAMTVPMQTGEVRIAQITADPTVSWKPENVTLTASDPTFGSVTLRARTLAVLTKIGLETVQDAANLERFVEQVFAGALAAEIDRVALVGTGAAEQPLGLQNVPGVGTATSVGSPNWNDLVDAMTTVRYSNGEPSAAILNPRDVGTLGKLVGTSNDHYIAPPSALSGMQILHTTNVPRNLGGGANESLAFVGDFSNLWIGVRSDLRIDATGEAGDSFAALQLWIRGYIRLDVAVVRPNHFVVLSGITA